jgi:hypothetical protein
MKVLTIEQMNKLKELGVDVNPKGTCLMYTSDSSDCYYLKYGESTCEDDVAAFGLQDIIELLPENVVIKRKKTYHTFYLNIEKCSEANWCVSYENDELFLVSHSTSNPLDSSYNMLITCIQEGYLKTK